jgi:hypothetical protein
MAPDNPAGAEDTQPVGEPMDSPSAPTFGPSKTKNSAP